MTSTHSFREGAPPKDEKGKVPYATQLFFVNMQEGGHLMHPEVKLGASGWRPDAFTVLNDV